MIWCDGDKSRMFWNRQGCNPFLTGEEEECTRPRANSVSGLQHMLLVIPRSKTCVVPHST